MIVNKILKHVSIASFGVYIPQYRISVEEICRGKGQGDWQNVVASLGVSQKSVADTDEDALTMAVAAAHQALKRSGIDKQSVGAVFVGSESHPYAVKPTATMVGEWLDLGNEYYAMDLEFACKAGSAGLQIAAGMIESGMIESALVIGTDKAQSKPKDALEYAAASCAVAFVLTRGNGICKLLSTYSFSSDTPDFWRRQTQDFPSHAGRFSGEPAYFKHVTQATKEILARNNKNASDFDHVVFHMPNGKFPSKVAKDLGVSKEQLANGFTVSWVGNPYSASSLLGLARVLAYGKKDENILMTSYGSGSGSDSFIFKMDKKGVEMQDLASWQQELDFSLKNSVSISYIEYLQKMRIL